MTNKKRRNRDKPQVQAAQPGVKPEDNVTRLVKNKDGLLVPSDQIEEECAHMEAAKRYTVETLGDVDLVCGDCDGDVTVHTMNFVVLSPEKMVELKEHLKKLAALAEQQAKRKKSGLILPGDVPPPGRNPA